MKLVLLGPNGQLGQDIQARADPRFDIVPVPRSQLDVTDAAAVAAMLPTLGVDVLVSDFGHVDLYL